MAATDPMSPNWRSLYEAAVLELDHTKLLLRVAEAERAVMSRINDVVRSGVDGESEALINALNVLRDLRKMVTTEQRSSDGNSEAQN